MTFRPGNVMFSNSLILIRAKKLLPTGGLEPPIFGLGDRRLIHWATRAGNRPTALLVTNRPPPPLSPAKNSGRLLTAKE
jgi:hypothetical protein